VNPGAVVSFRGGFAALMSTRNNWPGAERRQKHASTQTTSRRAGIRNILENNRSWARQNPKLLQNTLNFRHWASRWLKRRHEELFHTKETKVTKKFVMRPSVVAWSGGMNWLGVKGSF
jgi:hypothetical protein